MKYYLHAHKLIFKKLAELKLISYLIHLLVDSLRLLRDVINCTSYSITWALERKRFIYSL